MKQRPRKKRKAQKERYEQTIDRVVRAVIANKSHVTRSTETWVILSRLRISTTESLTFTPSKHSYISLRREYMPTPKFVLMHPIETRGAWRPIVSNVGRIFAASPGVAGIPSLTTLSFTSLWQRFINNSGVCSPLVLSPVCSIGVKGKTCVSNYHLSICLLHKGQGQQTLAKKMLVVHWH